MIDNKKLIIVLLIVFIFSASYLISLIPENEEIDQYQVDTTQFEKFDNNTINLTIKKSHIVSISEDETYYYFKIFNN